MKLVEKTFNSNSVDEDGFKSLCASINKSLKGLSPKEFVEIEPTDFEGIGKKSAVVSKLRTAYNLRFKGVSDVGNVGVTSLKVKKE